MSTMYLPDVGQVELELYRIDRAINEYDERLFLGRHPQNGELTVFVRMPRASGLAPIPVFGLPGVPHEGDYPTPEQVLKKLYECDTQRHASKMLDRMTRHNKQIEKHRNDELLERRKLAYEMIEHQLRSMGQSPVVKSRPVTPDRRPKF